MSYIGPQVINFRPSGDQEWSQWAECAKPGSPGMFPSDLDVEGLEDARKTCGDCPVVQECLEGALDRGEQYGVWGGRTTEERRVMTRKVTRAARVARGGVA